MLAKHLIASEIQTTNPPRNQRKFWSFHPETSCFEASLCMQPEGTEKHRAAHWDNGTGITFPEV